MLQKLILLFFFAGVTLSLLAAPLPEATKLTGETMWKDGVGTVAGKAGSLIFGDEKAVNYTATAELRLVAGGLPVGVVIFPAEPFDGTTSAFYCLNLVRGKGGLSLTGRRADWNAELKRWVMPKEPQIVLDFAPNPLEKNISPSITAMERDGVKAVPFPERWLSLRVEVTAANADLWLDGLLVRRLPLTDRRAGPVALVLSKGDQLRNVTLAPTKADPTYRPIELGALIRNGAEPAPVVAAVEHGQVPFLVLDAGKTSLDLHQAGWPDAQRDPSNYNEQYDDGALFLHDPRTPTLRVPVADYAAVHVLAVADDDAQTVAGFTVRAGRMSTRGQNVLYDFAASVPRKSEVARGRSTDMVKIGGQNYVHVRVPLPVAFGQDIFHWMDIQLTKEVRLARRRPDPSRFRYRPLGLPSGVQIAAITLERSPLQMRVTSKEAGHAFVEPTKPEFTVTLQNVSPQSQAFELQAVATHYDGAETKTSSHGKVDPGQTAEVKLAIPVTKRGYHDITIALAADGKPVFTRYTSFAVLPPDTRQHRDESPFGMWDFSGAHFTCPDPDITGSLYKKAGLRYGMSGFTAEERGRWGVRQSHVPKNLRTLEQYQEWMKKSPDATPDVMLLHEHAVSGGHTTRVPDIFHDRPPYQMNEKEKKQFDALRTAAESQAKLVRSNAPNVTLSLGNGALPLQEELLRQKFPKELFDALGNESSVFSRPPESQPPDYVGNNTGLWMQHELLKAYGYADKKVTQCYEVCYPSTNPGNVAPRTQASYFVRHCMHSMAWGIPIFRFGTIGDVGSSYGFGNWGAAGVVRPWPELNVKPSFVAVATMTRALDGAKFSRALDLGSPSLYGVEFKRPDKKNVYVLWTTRGERPVKFPVAGGSWLLTDEQGNETKPTAKDGALEVTLTTAPAYLIGAGELKTAQPGTPTHTDAPRGKVSELAALESLTGWKVETDRNFVLEYHSFMFPRRKGDFKFESLPEFAGENNVLRVTPQPIQGGKPTMPMYAVLRHEKGIPVPGEPTEIGVWVNGNSSSGRMIFELQDAKGQTWISIGASQKGELSPWLLDWMPQEALEDTKKSTQGDWNTDDVFGVSRINFDGWRYVGFPLPGNYPGERYHWAASSQWKSDGDGIVQYPLTLRAVIVELPEKTLHLTEFAPAPRPEIYLKRLVVAQDPASTVKSTISQWDRP